MKINVFTKNIEVVPLICKDDKDKFKIVLRYPNQFEFTTLIMNLNSSSFLNLACDLFVKFENKPTLINENGKEVKYETLKDMFNFGGKELLTILNCVIGKLKDTVLEAKKVEKKL